MFPLFAQLDLPSADAADSAYCDDEANGGGGDSESKALVASKDQSLWYELQNTSLH